MAEKAIEEGKGSSLFQNFFIFFIYYILNDNAFNALPSLKLLDSTTLQNTLN
jgi:hypothetical protein